MGMTWMLWTDVEETATEITIYNVMVKKHTQQF